MIKVNDWQKQDFARDVCGSMLQEAVEYVSTHYYPADVFEEEELQEWAEEHGYVKEEE